MGPSTLEDIVRAHQRDAGWNDASLILLLSRFIADRGFGGELDHYLAAQVEEEQGMSAGDGDD